MSTQGPVECAGIVADREHLSERAAHLRIPREQVRSVELVRASPVQHPLVMTVFGLVLVAVGLYGVRRVITWLLVGGVILELEIALAGFLLLGAYALYESAVQRVPVLRIRTTRGTHKLVFRGRVNEEDLRRFLARLESDLGYPVHPPEGSARGGRRQSSCGRGKNCPHEA